MGERESKAFNVKVGVHQGSVLKFCYLGDTLGAGKEQGPECFKEFKELSPILRSGDDWVSACRNVVVAGVRCAGRGRKTWRECVNE